MKFWVKLGIAASKNVYSQILFVKLPENGILVFFHLILHILCSLKHLNKSWCESIQFDSEVEWCYRSRWRQEEHSGRSLVPRASQTTPVRPRVTSRCLVTSCYIRPMTPRYPFPFPVPPWSWLRHRPVQPANSQRHPPLSISIEAQRRLVFDEGHYFHDSDSMDPMDSDSVRCVTWKLLRRADFCQWVSTDLRGNSVSRATEHRLPYEIPQCYLPPDTSERTLPQSQPGRPLLNTYSEN